MSDMVFHGLDGSNPISLLAALGLLEIATDREVGARLSWQDDGVWRPVLTGCDIALDELLAWIETDQIACVTEPALALTYDGGRQDIKALPATFRRYLEDLVNDAHPGRRRGVDWAAALGSDVVQDEKGNTKPTALHFTAGQQQFLKMVNELATGVAVDDIVEALAGPWRYAKPLPVLAWDATIGRDYALRANNPSNDKKLGVPGADWLAVRGLPCLPVVPIGKRLVTTGCSGGWKTGSFCWPLWSVPLDRAMVRTLLRLPLDNMSSEERAARGVTMVYRAGIKRSEQGGYGSFTPGSVV